MMLWQHGPPSLVAREVREAFIKADLVHFQWPGHLIAWLPVARRFKKPILVSLRGRQINVVPHVPGQYCYVRQLREALPLCDAYHCVSEHIRNAAEQYGLVPSRARVIRPAVDTTFFTPGNSLDSYGAIRIVMVGSLIWLKGYEYALMALCKVVQSGLDVGLTIVGEGPDEDRILRTAEDLGIHSHVALRTRLSPAEIRQLLQDHHIFLHASLSEGLANVVLEAMACGLPVVSTDVGGMPEAIDDSVEGYLVPSRAADAMADRLMKLAMRPDIRMAMGQKARARAVRDFDLKDQGRKFVELYQEVLSQHENRVS
jgi:colanic acid/amylovoran biosynthesis glycosyltransferase